LEGCVQLIEQILVTLDDICRMPQGSDLEFAMSCAKQFPKNNFYGKINKTRIYYHSTIILL
jgi:myosin heavy subunit